MLIALTAVTALALAGAGGAWWYTTSRFDAIHTQRVEGLQRKQPGQPFNALVVGSDTRDLSPAEAERYGGAAAPGGQRSDVMMVLRVEPATHRVLQLSIPRDLVVTIAGTSRRDIIAAAFADGPSRLVTTVEQTLGIPIHHYVLINFSGFKRVIDELDGIDVDFPVPARDFRSGLQATRTGCQRLSGETALALARSRHFQYLDHGAWRSDPLSDLGRIRRQQAFLHGLVRTAKDRGLSNPVRANRFVGSIARDLTKDDQLRLRDLVRLAAEFRSFDPSALETYTVPSKPFGQRLLIDQPKLRGVTDPFRGRPAASPTTTTARAPREGTAASGPRPATTPPGTASPKPARPAPDPLSALRPFDPRPC